MDIPKEKKFSSHLVLTAVLSGGITITLSLIYILLSIAAIIFRFTKCSSIPIGSKTFWAVITAAYIREDCEALPYDITPSYTVFVLATITLSISVLCVTSASVLVATIQDVGMTRYLTMVVSFYVGTNLASLVVDLTTAAHFGIDHSTVTSLMDSGNVTDQIYILEMLRHGAFLLMSIGLKGYVALLINWILIILLIVYLMEHRKLMKGADHSIHKVGALNAFDRLLLYNRHKHKYLAHKAEDTRQKKKNKRQPRKPDDNNWARNNNSREPEVFPPYARGAQVNNGFNDDDSERGARRTPMKSETNYSNRSDSWHRSQPSLAQSSRPFSYLEDIKRPPVPARPPPSPAVEAPWSHRDPWPQPQGPPVPAPDYSPQPRRLKSALKPGGQW